MKRSSLKRKTRLKARRSPRSRKKGLGRSKGVRKVNRARRSKAWVRAFHSPEFVQWTSEQPCVRCHVRSCEAHHEPTRSAGGTWKSVVPLCAICHHARHSMGVESFWADVGRPYEPLTRAHHFAWLEHSSEVSR